VPLVFHPEDESCMGLSLKIGLVAQCREISPDLAEVVTGLGFLEFHDFGFVGGQERGEKMAQIHT